MKKFDGDTIILHNNFAKSQSYDKQFLKYRVRQAEFFCSFGSFFALLTTPNDPENQNFEKKRKKKKMPADIILLYIHVYHK